MRAASAVVLLAVIWTTSATWAADVVTGASPSVQNAGSEGRIWITGRGFQAGAMVSVSGAGVSET